MTETEIIKHLARSIDTTIFPYQAQNIFIWNWECDYWTMDNAGVTREFEIKISRSDYLCDRNKPKHLETGANYFYYVCPIGLIKPEEVQKSYGLIHIGETGLVQLVKRPSQLHYNRFDKWKDLANKMYWRWREMWKAKYLNEEITIDEYKQAFNIDLQKIET